MAPDRRSIGQVLKILTGDFPDVTISKIRFLEAEGLVTPQRTASGYRRCTAYDCARLRFILTAQKNHYLPLKVIREHLALMDSGEEPPRLEPPQPDVVIAPEAPSLAGTAQRPAKHPIRITRRDLVRLSGISEGALVELERHALVFPRRGTVYYGRDALTVAVVARKLAEYGLDARHLRAVKQAAEREAGLVEQAVAQHPRRGQNQRQTVHDVLQLVLHAHAAILRSSISP